MKKLNNSNLGALHELKASTWLMEKGYEVFRNLSPVGDIDIIARHKENKEFLLIDVCTSAAHKAKDGTLKIYIPKTKQSYCKEIGIKLLVVDQYTNTIFFDPDT